MAPQRYRTIIGISFQVRITYRQPGSFEHAGKLWTKNEFYPDAYKNHESIPFVMKFFLTLFRNDTAL